jgi:hypothetical protein
MLWTPPAWAVGTTYAMGQVVSYDDGFGSRYWLSVASGNVGNIPTNNNQWENYFGSLVATPYTVKTNYYAGDLVYETQSNGTFKVYMSLMSGNAADPSVTNTWDATVTYDKGTIVTYASTNYISNVDGNINLIPPSFATQWTVTASTGSYQWVLVGTNLVALNIFYPLQAGPFSQSQTKNVFPLPYGYLRKCNQDPKAGSTSFLGAPSSLLYNDWIFEGGYIVSRQSDPIVLRFTADVTNIRAMDAMFCEGFAARIALEVCEIITQSTEKLKNISGEYAKFMTEARTVNGIENEAEEAPRDDYLAVRY